MTAPTTAAGILASGYAGAAMAGAPGIAEDGGRYRSVESVAGIVRNGGGTGADVPAARAPVGAAVPDLLRVRADLAARHPDHAVPRIRVMDAGLPLARYLASRYRFDAAVTDRHRQPLLAAPPAPQRRILALCCVADRGRAEIAAQIGLSPIQVSRLLLRTLTPPHTGLPAEQPPRSTCRHSGRQA